MCLVSRQYKFFIKPSHLTYMLLDAFLDLSLVFSKIKAVAVISFTRNFINSAGSSTRRCLVTVHAHPLNFVFVWAVTWLSTQVGIRYTPQKFSFEVAK